MSGATPAGQTDLLAERKRSIAHASSSDIDRSDSGGLFSSGIHLSSCIDDGTQRNLKTAPDQARAQEIDVMEVRLMKPVGIISTGVLLLLLGSVAPTYAQQDQQQEAKPPKQVQQAKPEKQQQDRNKQQQDKNKQQQQQRAQKQQPDQNKQQQQRAQKQQVDQNKQQQQRAQKQQQDQNRQQQHQQQDNRSSRQGQRVQPGQQREVWQQHRARNWQSEHRDWQQRGGYNGYRIPDDRYRGNFGANHWFRIHRYPMELYGGYPRFQYGGFWFGFMDPWPEYWADDWYDNDDVYVVYSEDGYYLYNRRYPRDRIAITVYVN